MSDVYLDSSTLPATCNDFTDDWLQLNVRYYRL